MPNVIEYISFNLKKEASLPDFLLASEKMNVEILSVQKGYISRNLLVEGELWADWVLWETMEDALSAANAFGENEANQKYISFIENVDIDMHHFTIEQSF